VPGRATEGPDRYGTLIADEVGVMWQRLTWTMLAVVASTTIGTACGSTAGTLRLPAKPPSQEQLAELWVDPGSDSRDLFWGVGGEKYAPAKDAHYKLEHKDESGFSVSYDVIGPDATEWSAKIGAEAQTEVLVSRLLWGLGYHQPPVYYLPAWNLVAEGSDVKRESEARFRPKLDSLERASEFWAWADNPFLGTRPFNGLFVILLMFNSTDLKDDNNSIYELKRPWPGAGDVRRWFVVRDLGAALGETGKLYPRRNWIDGFEKEGFITGVKDGKIQFAYTGRHQELLAMVTPEDLRWAASRLQRLSDRQWADAFRAANYADAIRDRYLRKIRQKIEEALKVSAMAQGTGRV
jgi:hypothetical protein